MYGYVYKITNTINNKIYIGKHKYSKPELDENYIASGILINKSIKKYGLNNFKREIICICENLDELNEKECFYIKELQSEYPNGYNLTKGGDGISDPSPEIRRKNGLAHRGLKQSVESNLKRSAKLKQVKHTDEWVQKISNSLKGKKVSDKTIAASIVRHKNSVWYNDGVKEYMIPEGQIIPNNYVKGRLKSPFPDQTGKPKPKEQLEKVSEKLSGSQWYNNGEKEIMVQKNKQVPDGFIKGRLKRIR